MDASLWRSSMSSHHLRCLQVDYVLGEWSDKERKALPERLKVFGDAILSFTTIGLERTMNFFNKK